MSTPINLNQHRKAQARARKKAQADANAVQFGRSKADKTATTQANARAARRLDEKALETPLSGAGRDDKKS